MRFTFFVIMTAIFSVSAFGQPTAPAPEPPLIGAIRWDAWTAWDKYQAFLQPEEWRSRLPFFAKEKPGGGMIIRGDSEEVMGRELDYAQKAGIAYWAWCWYDPTTQEAREWHMNDCLDIYRAHPDRAKVNYCVIGPGYYATTHWVETVDRFVAMFQESNYQKLAGNRPLFYYFMADDCVPHFGDAEKARAAIASLREKTLAAGLGSPYIVALSFWPDKGAKAVDEVGFDAISSYSNPGDSKGRVLPYGDLAGLNKWFWNACKETGKPFVVNVNTGWDPRPRVSIIGGEQAPDAYTAPTPAEFGAHLRDAIQWTRDNPAICQANTILVYAWNEFDEGGWLCPTLSEGAARLDAIQEALGK